MCFSHRIKSLCVFVWCVCACVGRETRKGTVEMEQEREGNGRYMACWDAGSRRRALRGRWGERAEGKVNKGKAY